MNRVFIGLGGNIGNLPGNFNEAKRLIREEGGILTRASSLYRSRPLGFVSEDDFMNQVIEIHSVLSPANLLETLLVIEKKLGRIRVPGKYTSRTIDLDILYYNDLIIHSEALSVPHPRIGERKFVLVPLVEIAPAFIHPLLGKTQRQLLEICPDTSLIQKLSETER